MEEQKQNMNTPQNENMNASMDGQPIPGRSENKNQHENKPHGALIGSIIIIIILIMGGIYLLKNKVNLINEEPANVLTEEPVDILTEELNEGEVVGSEIELSSSDDLSDLEADLDSVSNLDLDAGLE